MVNLTLMRVQLAGLEQILIQVAFILTKIASMAQTIDTDWFQLWFFITGDEIIIFKQLVSKCCAFIYYEFFIVTTSALYRDSMIAEIIKIYEKHETLLRIFLGRGIFTKYSPVLSVITGLQSKAEAAAITN